jgi:hypothetical protein
LRACVVETVKVTDKTMDIVEPGDTIVVNKLNYGLRIPGSGALMLQWQSITRGDLVVVVDVSDPPQTLLRRIAAVPGDSYLLPTDTHGVNRTRVLKADEYAVTADKMEGAPTSTSFGAISRRAIIGKAKYIWRGNESRLKSIQ